MTEKLTLTIQEVADLTGLSRDFVQGAIVRGELPAKMVGQRTRRILREDLGPWLRSLQDA